MANTDYQDDAPGDGDVAPQNSSSTVAAGARLSLLLEQTPGSLIGIDAQERITFCNAAALRLLGHGSTETMRGIPVTELIDRSGSTALQGHQASVRIAHGSETCRQTVALRRRDGSAIEVDLVSAPVSIDHEVTRWLLSVAETSARLSRERSLETAKLEADAASRAKSEFLANMSHEIRTPLSAIISFSDLLLTSEGSKEIHESASAIKRNAHSLLELLNDILDLSKIEADQVELDSRPVSIVSLLDDLKTTLEVRAAEKGLQLRCDANGAVPEIIRSDRVKLRQILVNLLNNAIKFTHHGEVAVDVSYADPELLFTVRDTGIGMDGRTLDGLFEPFNQGDRSIPLQYGGSGLGLSICRRLVRKMGGRISVTSEPGRGSVFTVAIPAGDVSQVRFISEVSRDKPDIAQRAASALVQLNCHLLLVDDRPDVLLALKQLLEQAGAEVDIASDGIDAIAVLERSPTSFDAFVLDLDMPRMDGYETLRVLRRRNVSGPVIALTAHAGDTARESILAQGFDDYLTKPVDIEVLCNTLHRVLNRESSGHSTAVMVIDDHADTAAALAQLLRLHGCVVETAANGSEARHLLHDFHPDFCLIDVGLPDIDGVALLQELQGRRELTRTAFIATTGTVDQASKQRFLAAGFSDFVPKPVDFAQLQAILKLRSANP